MGVSKKVNKATGSSANNKPSPAASSAPSTSKQTLDANNKSNDPLEPPSGASSKSSSSKRKKFLTRGKRGGSKNAKPQSEKQIQKSHELIAKMHTLQKQAALESDPQVKRQLREKEKALGGLKAYQDASVSASQTGGETSKWLIKTLVSLLPDPHKDQLPHLSVLDVGAISGSAYAKWPMLHTTSIDVNPRSDIVKKMDWLKSTPQALDVQANSFDLVALSLVLNYEGELDKRAAMILQAHTFLKPDGKLYIVLPRACIDNSRYLTPKHFKAMLSSFGFSTVLKSHESAKLSYWLLQRDGEDAAWDGTVYRKKEVHPGIARNNFAITIKEDAEL